MVVEQEMQLISQLGQVAGIAGISLAIFFLIFRSIIVSASDTEITPGDKYKIARLMLVLTYRLAVFCLSVSLAGFVVYLLVDVYMRTH